MASKTLQFYYSNHTAQNDDVHGAPFEEFVPADAEELLVANPVIPTDASNAVVFRSVAEVDKKQDDVSAVGLDESMIDDLHINADSINFEGDIFATTGIGLKNMEHNNQDEINSSIDDSEGVAENHSGNILAGSNSDGTTDLGVDSSRFIQIASGEAPEGHMINASGDLSVQFTIGNEQITIEIDDVLPPEDNQLAFKEHVTDLILDSIQDSAATTHVGTPAGQVTPPPGTPTTPGFDTIDIITTVD